MTCDKYKNALLLVAASNDEPDRELARHLERCSRCRMAVRAEKELFWRIDSTLRAQVNEAPAAGFLAQLRFQVSKEPTAQLGSNRVWHAAGAAVALALIATFYPLINARQSIVQQNPQTSTMEAPQNARVTQPARGSEDLGVRSGHHFKRSAVRSAVRREAEVLVPPDEQKAFAQFVACVARRDTMAQAMVTPAGNKTVRRSMELPQVSSVEIADLQSDRPRKREWMSRTGNSE